MPNAYYTFTDTFTPGARARSGDIDRELAAVEAGFDNLPSTVSALTRGISTFAPETGSGNAYVVTMPDTRTSNQDGDEVIFFATHGNTGNTTLDIDGIGAVSLRDRGGVEIGANGIVSGRLYIATYDVTNAFFVLDVAINVINNIIDKIQGSSTDDPTAPGIFNADLEFQNSVGAVLANVGFNADTDFAIINRVQGGRIILIQENAAGTAITADIWPKFATVKVTSFILVAFEEVIIEATGSAVIATAPITLVIGDRFVVHNASTSTMNVTIDPATHSITGAIGTITSSDDLILAVGESVIMIARTTAILEVI